MHKNNTAHNIKRFLKYIISSIQYDIECVRHNKYLYSSYINERVKIICCSDSILDILQHSKYSAIHSEDLNNYLHHNLLNLKSIAGYKNELQWVDYYQLKLDWYSYELPKAFNVINNIIKKEE